MEYEFSVASFFIGLLILGAGVAFVKWHQAIADNLGGGASSYDHYRLYALVTCGLGLVVMLNLHVMILKGFVTLLFPGL